MRRIVFIVRWIFAILAGSPMVAAAAPFSDLIVFGDSLSDNGNAGRFSNGPVWVERIAETLGLNLQPARAGGTNYAVGGASTQGGPIDVLSQTSAFLTHRHADPDALHILFAGANDLLASACHASDGRVAREAAEALGIAIDQLAEAGAVHFLVPNLPDIGRAPLIRAQGGDCVENALALTRMYNAALDRVLAEVQTQRQIRLLRLDVFSLAENVFASPKKAGFRDVTTPCHGVGCNGALFWDQLHPTTEAHALLARRALGALGINPP